MKSFYQCTLLNSILSSLSIDNLSTIPSTSVLNNIFGYSDNEDYFHNYTNEQLSRILAGRSFSQARKNYLENFAPPEQRILNLNDKICGVGLVPFPNSSQDSHFYLSFWRLREVTTFTYKIEGSNYSESMNNFIKNVINSESTNNVNQNENSKIVHHENVNEKVNDVLELRANYITILPTGEVLVDQVNSPEKKNLILSGSFNPLHHGHVKMVNAAKNSFNFDESKCYYELAIQNADKGKIALDIILDRCAQFSGKSSFILTREPFFINKARLINNSSFIIGYDTAIRVVNEKYYNNSKKEMIDELNQFKEYKSDLLVCGRSVNNEWSLEFDVCFHSILKNTISNLIIRYQWIIYFILFQKTSTLWIFHPPN